MSASEVMTGGTLREKACYNNQVATNSQNGLPAIAGNYWLVKLPLDELILEG